MVGSKAFVADGDLGSGEPGSLQWHSCHIAQMTTTKECCDYLIKAWPNMSDDVKLGLVVFLIEDTDASNTDNCT